MNNSNNRNRDASVIRNKSNKAECTLKLQTNITDYECCCCCCAQFIRLHSLVRARQLGLEKKNRCQS